MAITKETHPLCLYVVWDETGALKGAAMYEQTVVRDGTQILSVTQCGARPVSLTGEVGLDLAPIIGRIGTDALALAEQKEAGLQSAIAEKSAAESARDTALEQVEELTKQLAELLPKQVTRVATVALLIIMRRRSLRDQLDAIIDSLPVEQSVEVKEMLALPYTRRDHPLVAMVQQAFKWTDAQVDELFSEADAV